MSHTQPQELGCSHSDFLGNASGIQRWQNEPSRRGWVWSLAAPLADNSSDQNTQNWSEDRRVSNTCQQGTKCGKSAGSQPCTEHSHPGRLGINKQMKQQLGKRVSTHCLGWTGSILTRLGGCRDGLQWFGALSPLVTH